MSANPDPALVEAVARAIFRCDFEGDWDEAVIEQCWQDASDDERHIPETLAAIEATLASLPDATRAREVEVALSAGRAENPHAPFTDGNGTWNDGFSTAWAIARAALSDKPS